MRKRTFLVDLSGRFLSRPYLVCDYCNVELMDEYGYVEAYAVVDRLKGDYWISSVICPDCRQRAFRKYEVVADESLIQTVCHTLNYSCY